MYDLIGDIHGHADDLEQLLKALGYRRSHGVYRHPDRQVIFLGDFIDRGPQIRQVLEIVRPMTDEGAALAVMGNHELNALAFHTEDPESPGGYLRRHTEKNFHQHSKTLEQLAPGELRSNLNWFRCLPLWLDLDGLRVVHACWDDRAIKQIATALNEHEGITTAFLLSACKEGKSLYAPVELILKGKDAALPEGISFPDKDGNVRTRARVRWYDAPQTHTYRTYALTDQIECDLALETSVINDAVPYPTTDKPVFIGHYWLSDTAPQILAENVACIDYSVAKGGFLCAYRWDGEQKLKNEHFVWNAGEKFAHV